MVIHKNFLNKADDELRAINSVLEEFKSNPEVLSEFIVDVTNGKHKKWHIYKAKLGIERNGKLKGRPVVLRKKMPSISMEPMRALIRGERNELFSGCLPLHKCRTDKDRVDMILKADIEPDIKAWLLEDYI